MARPDLPAVELLRLRWRTGRKLGRTLYAQAGADAADEDVYVAMFDDATVARYVAATHNAALEDERSGDL